jgi:hypothetical protein
VTKDGAEIITRFPAEELLVAGRRYRTAGGSLPTTRETQSNLNADGRSRVVHSARHEASKVKTDRS